MIFVQGDSELLEIVRALDPRAASRADCTAGSSIAISTAMIAITTNNSISVNPRNIVGPSSDPPPGGIKGISDFEIPSQ